MSPLESALAMKCLAGGETADVRRVSLVQADGAVADQESATRAVAASLGQVTIDIHGSHLPQSSDWDGARNVQLQQVAT